MSEKLKDQVPRYKYLLLNIYVVGMIMLEWMDELENTPIFIRNLKSLGKRFIKQLEGMINIAINNIFENGEFDYHEMCNDYSKLTKLISTYDPKELDDFISIANAYKNNKTEFRKHFQMVKNDINQNKE